ncbi:MAG: hypothetical protein J1E03_11265 [Acetatifactor sp.]|nr:hypothetical protein [Lachnospiraceae bacterium]MCH5339352.1 hypothetical protein [Acetatifactor sp.]
MFGSLTNKLEDIKSDIKRGLEGADLSVEKMEEILDELEKSKEKQYYHKIEHERKCEELRRGRLEAPIEWDEIKKFEGTRDEILLNANFCPSCGARLVVGNKYKYCATRGCGNYTRL